MCKEKKKKSEILFCEYCGGVMFCNWAYIRRERYSYETQENRISLPFVWLLLFLGWSIGHGKWFGPGYFQRRTSEKFPLTSGEPCCTKALPCLLLSQFSIKVNRFLFWKFRRSMVLISQFSHFVVDLRIMEPADQKKTPDAPATDAEPKQSKKYENRVSISFSLILIKNNAVPRRRLKRLPRSKPRRYASIATWLSLFHDSTAGCEG